MQSSLKFEMNFNINKYLEAIIKQYVSSKEHCSQL